MSNFGEVIHESSRAFADDEGDYDSDDEECNSQFGLNIEWTEEGEKYLKEAPEGSHAHTLCAFVGTVALGFGEGFLSKKDSEEFCLLGQVYMTGNEGTVDLFSKRPKKKPKVRIYLGGKGSSNPVIYALVDFFGVPRILSNEVAIKLSKLLKLSSDVVVFHSETSAFHRGEENCEGKLLFLHSTNFTKKNGKNIPRLAARLKSPNLISGPSAAILTHCQMTKTPCLLLIVYCETEMVDSISMKPFFQAIEQPKGEAVPDGFNLANILSRSNHSLFASAKCNVNSVANSNLYV